MELANYLQDEVIRRLGIVDAEAQYTKNDVGVPYHAWLGHATAKRVYVMHAKNQVTQESVAAALAGDVIQLVERGVYYAANEMQLLEDSIGKFKKRLAILIGVDNSAPSRRKEGKAVWEKTKEAAEKKKDTELLTQMGLVDWAKAPNEQHATRLSATLR
jgi:hypothetical protein